MTAGRPIFSLSHSHFNYLSLFPALNGESSRPNMSGEPFGDIRSRALADKKDNIFLQQAEKLNTVCLTINTLRKKTQHQGQLSQATIYRATKILSGVARFTKRWLVSTKPLSQIDQFPSLFHTMLNFEEYFYWLGEKGHKDFFWPGIFFEVNSAKLIRRPDFWQVLEKILLRLLEGVRNLRHQVSCLKVSEALKNGLLVALRNFDPLEFLYLSQKLSSL